jgi:hypothetical protein
LLSSRFLSNQGSEDWLSNLAFSIFLAIPAFESSSHFLAEAALVRSITTCHEDYFFVTDEAVMFITHHKFKGSIRDFPSLLGECPAGNEFPDRGPSSLFEFGILGRIERRRRPNAQ